MTTTTTQQPAQTVYRTKLALNPEGGEGSKFQPVTVMLPAGFRITAMQMTKEIKPGSGAVEIYTLVNPYAEHEPRVFQIARTGEVLPHAGNAVFHFTMAFPGMPALHLFELL